MGRNFDGTDDKIDFGDIYGFSRSDAWSTGAFVRFESSTHDDNCIIAKYGTDANTRRLLIRTDLQAAPTNIEVYQSGALKITGASSLALDTWYLVFLTCSGAVAVNDLTLYSFAMDGTAIDNGVNGSTQTDVATSTASVTVGRTDANSDEIQGDAAHFIIVNAELTSQEIQSYLRYPYQMARVFKAAHGVTTYHPLGIASPEPDFTGSGITGTVTGAVVGDNPPVAPFGFSDGWQGAFTPAVGGGTTIPIFAHHYQLLRSA